MPSPTNLLAFASLAILALSVAPAPAAALVADRAQVARHVQAHPHGPVARRKRDSANATCKPRPSSAPPSTPTPPSTPAPPSTPTPTPTPTSAPSSSAPPPSTTPTAPSSGHCPISGSKKWGLAGGPPDFTKFAFPNLNYVYDWSPTPPTASQYGLQSIPMFWGPSKVPSAQDFQNQVLNGYGHGGIVFGMNEPNEPSQSNLSPSDAVNLWMQYIVPLGAQGYHLVSPACTDDDAGTQWYHDFITGCEQTPGCYVDAIAFHSYNPDPQHLIDYANMLHDTYGKCIWITEFADQNFSGVGGQADMSDVWNYAGKVHDFINGANWIAGAFPFGIMYPLAGGVDSNNLLLNPDGSPTALASFYFS